MNSVIGYIKVAHGEAFAVRPNGSPRQHIRCSFHQSK